MLNLGDFKLAAYEVTACSFARGDDYAELKVIEGKPVTQFIGSQCDAVSITATFDASLSGPPAERIAALDAIRGSGFALSTVSGRQYGRYYIESITISPRKLTQRGDMINCAVQIELKEDGAEITVEAQRRQAAANAPAKRYIETGSEDAGSFRR